MSNGEQVDDKKQPKDLAKTMKEVSNALIGCGCLIVMVPVILIILILLVGG